MKLPIITSLFMLISLSVTAKEEIKTISPCDTQIIDCTSTQEQVYQTHKLERVIDGDTIVASGKTIRLWGIDAPENNTPYYLAAKLLLESLIQEGNLTCKAVEQDKYKRHVMHCLIEQLDIGPMMVLSGMAKNYSHYSGDYYLYEEKQAQTKKRGVWSAQQNN